MYVILKTLQDTINEKGSISSELNALLDGSPPAEFPVPNTDETTNRQELARGLNNELTLATEPLPYERDVATFPGIVSAETQRIYRTIPLDLSVLGQTSDFRMTQLKDWQPICGGR